MILHAGLLACFTPAGWRGVLLEGPSGCGKSDLALRAGAEGFRLVADDRVLLWVSDGVLYGRAPPALAGLLEVRGLDVVTAAHLPMSRVVLAARCLTPDDAPERLPEPAYASYLGVRLPQFSLAPREASAPARLRYAFEHLG